MNLAMGGIPDQRQMGINQQACPHHLPEAQVSDEPGADDCLRHSDLLPELEESTCQPDTTTMAAKAGQAQTINLTATCGEAAAWSPFSIVQEVSSTTSIS